MFKTSRVAAAATAALPLGCVCRLDHQSMRRSATTMVSSAPLAVAPTALSQQHVRCISTRSVQKLHLRSSAVVPQTAVRLQHTSAAAAAAAGGTATQDAPHVAAADAASPPPGGEMHVDPRRLPSTIPGMSQEELAARITTYHSKRAQEASALSSQALGQEIEMMRRSLSPNDFAEYMANVEKGMATAAKEQAKLAAMSPLELHQYQQKKKRQAVRYEWYKTFVFLFAILGSTAFMFALFVFFN